MAILRGQQISKQLSGSYTISGSTQELIGTSITLTGNVTASGTIKADAFESVTGGTTIDFNDDINIEGSVSGSSTSTGSFGSLVVADKVQGDIQVVGNISGSSTSTGSFGSLETSGNINTSGRIFESGTSVIDHATAMAIVFGG